MPVIPNFAKIWCFVSVLVIWAGLYLPGLGRLELQGEEPRRALPGKTMLQSGDWVQPMSAGEIYNRKPPLVNWAVAASAKLTGQWNEWAVRLPSVLAVLGAAIGILVWGRWWLGWAGACFASILFLTHLGMIEKGRLIEIEALYIASFGLAITAWMGSQARGQWALSWILSGFFLGIGMLAKGPVHWFFFLAIVGFSLHGRREWGQLKHWGFYLGLILTWGWFLPWAMMNMESNPEGDSGTVWLTQLTSRLGFADFNFKSWILVFPQSLLNFFPWILFVFLLFPRNVKKLTAHRVSDQDELDQKLLRGMLLGTVIVWFVLAFMPSTRPRFILPLNVPLCLALGWIFSRAKPFLLDRVLLHWKTTLQCVGGFVMIVLIGAAFYPTWVGFEKALPLFLWLILLAWTLFRFTSVGGGIGPLKLAWSSAMILIGMMLVFSTSGIPLMKKRDRHRPLAEAVISMQNGVHGKTVIYDMKERPFVFYLGMDAYEVKKARELPKDTRWLVTTAKKWEKDQAKIEENLGPAIFERIVDQSEVREDYRIPDLTIYRF